MLENEPAGEHTGAETLRPRRDRGRPLAAAVRAAAVMIDRARGIDQALASDFERDRIGVAACETADGSLKVG
jgi:hypothetical protein